VKWKIRRGGNADEILPGEKSSRSKTQKNRGKMQKGEQRWFWKGHRNYEEEGEMKRGANWGGTKNVILLQNLGS